MRTALPAYGKAAQDIFADTSAGWTSQFSLPIDASLPSVQATYSKLKILEVVEAEINERFVSVKGQRLHLEADTMRRVHQARLPLDDSQRATELLTKVTAIDRARVEAEKECARQNQEAKAAKEAQRMAEFAAARANAMSEARGAALLKKNAALAEAHNQQLKLSEMLQVALRQLGYDFVPELESPCLPQPTHEISRLPEAEEDRAQQQSPSHDTATTNDKMNTGALHPSGLLGDRADAGNGRDTPDGFTIYSNELSETHSPTPPLCGDSSESVESDSAAHWRDISEAVVVGPTSPSASSAATPLNALVPGTAAPVAEDWAEREARRLMARMNATQLESLVRIGSLAASGAMPSPDMRRQVLEVAQQASKGTPAAEDEGPKQARKVRHSAGITGTEEEDGHRKAASCGSGGYVQQGKTPAVQRDTESKQEPHKHLPSQDFYLPLGNVAHTLLPIKADVKQRVGPLARGAAGSNASSRPLSTAFAVASVSGPTNDNKKDDEGLIKAVPSPRKDVSKHSLRSAATAPQASATCRTKHCDVDGDGDVNARQRRAAERLVSKLNAKLPPEYQRADPAAFGLLGGGGR
jgi:hypothetical protein